MVLNGKAELVGKVAPATKNHYEQVELCVILATLVAAGTLSWQLYINMVEGWQLDTRKSWRVLVLSSSLLVLSIIACVYLCQRLQPVRLHSARPRSLSSVSVNSRLRLLTSEGDRPPSYEAVARLYLTQPPPPYSEVVSV